MPETMNETEKLLRELKLYLTLLNKSFAEFQFNESHYLLMQKHEILEKARDFVFRINDILEEL